MRPVISVMGLIFALISGVFAALFAANNPMPVVSTFMIFVIAFPSMIGAVRVFGVVKGLVMFGIFGLYALIFESIAISTGIPYGAFAYGSSIGGKIYGLVPWTVLFSWTPIVFGLLPVAVQIAKRGSLRWLVMTVGLLLVDLVLDPAAVHLGFWSWESGGFYYGVPFVNFVGWIVSGGIAAVMLIYLSSGLSARVYEYRSLFMTSLLMILGFWTSVAFVSELYLPCFLGSILIFFLCWNLFKPTGNS